MTVAVLGTGRIYGIRSHNWAVHPLVRELQWPTPTRRVGGRLSCLEPVTSMARIRTNIELEESLLRVIVQRYGLHTKTDAVDLALRHLADSR